MKTAASPCAHATTIGRFLPRSRSPATCPQARKTAPGVRIHSSGTAPRYAGAEDQRHEPVRDHRQRHEHARGQGGAAEDREPLQPVRRIGYRALRGEARKCDVADRGDQGDRERRERDRDRVTAEVRRRHGQRQHELVELGVEGGGRQGGDLRRAVRRERPDQVRVRTPGRQPGAPAAAVGPAELKQHGRRRGRPARCPGSAAEAATAGRS